MARKKGMKKKKWSAQAALWVMFMLTLFLVLLLFSFSWGQRVTLTHIMDDDTLDEDEMSFLSTLGCEEIKELLGTTKNVCLYVKDESGEYIELGEETIGVGCSGVVIDGEMLCG